MKRGREVGEDGLIIVTLQLGGEPILVIPETLYNKCLQENTTPTDWNNATIIPLYEKGDRTQLDNY